MLDPMNEPRTASQVLGLTLEGRYRVIEPISSGAMGAVYRALDVETGNEVALKQCTNPHHDQRFEADALLLSSLQHPRVVRIRDHFSAPSGQYFESHQAKKERRFGQSLPVRHLRLHPPLLTLPIRR
jgi:serine/threonine protein kinase